MNAPDPACASLAQREHLLEIACRMSSSGLNVGTAGNASLRLSAHGDAVLMLITPSGLAAEHCSPADLVVVNAAGAASGQRAPSSEWQLHRDLYAAFGEAGAVLHAHSPFATALACQRRPIPPFHYMIARFGGDSVRCAPYHLFGSAALSAAAVAALTGRSACLLANHGMVVHGRDPEHALALAIELETLCAQYWRSLQLGPPALLTADEMAAVLDAFRWYGKPRSNTPEANETGNGT